MMLDLDRIEIGTEATEGDEVIRFQDAADEDVIAKCHVTAAVRRVGETFYIDADVTGTYEMACHKCLAPSRFEVNPSFNIVLQRADARTAVPEGDNDDFVQIPRTQRQFSLDPYIHENVVLAIPIRAYCKEDCRGLCPRCGKNLNKETCQCAPPTDSRWDALKNLKQPDQ